MMIPVVLSVHICQLCQIHQTRERVRPMTKNESSTAVTYAGCTRPVINSQWSVSQTPGACRWYYKADEEKPISVPVWATE